MMVRKFEKSLRFTFFSATIFKGAPRLLLGAGQHSKGGADMEKMAFIVKKPTSVGDGRHPLLCTSIIKIDPGPQIHAEYGSCRRASIVTNLKGD